MSEKSKEAGRRSYWKHRKERLKKVKDHQAAMTEEQKEARRKYARDWYRRKYAKNPQFRKSEVERSRRNRREQDKD